MFPRKLQTIRILNAAVATGPGPAHEVVGERLAFYISIATTATVKIETSPDGTTWLDTSIVNRSASCHVHLNELHRFVRANVTAWTAGAVNVDLVQQV